MEKHEKVLINKGRLGVLKKTISAIGKEFPDFKEQMKSLPDVQKLTTHYYLYVPIAYVKVFKDKFEEIEFYGE